MNNQATKITLILSITVVACALIIAQAGLKSCTTITDGGIKTTKEVVGLANSLGNYLGNVLNAQPKITVTNEGSTVIEVSNISEWAIVSRKIQVVSKYEHTWLHSTKTLILSGSYLAKAGYDMKQPFRIYVDEAGKLVELEFPEPKVLSMEPVNRETFFTDGGVLNKLNPNDYQTALEQLDSTARAEINKSGILNECQDQLKTRVKDMLALYDSSVTVQFRAPKSPADSKMQ